MNELKQFWQQLKPRERLMLTIAGGFLGIIIVYLSILEPILTKADRLEKQLQEQELLVKWMQNAVVEAKRLSRGNGTKIKVGAGGQSLLGIIDRTAKAQQLGDSMKRVEPDGSSRVRVWLERASFDDMIRWLEKLQRDYDVVLDSAVVDREGLPGRVNARLIFVGVA